MERARPLPSRRRLLTGAALAALPGSLLSVAPAAARATYVDDPSAEWSPADPANYTVAERPLTHPIDHVVIHVAQETYEDTLAIFGDPTRRVSAHYVVSSRGRLAQCVREADIGWHAGNWDHNTRSVGIEHEGWVDRPWFFTHAMYERSARLTAGVCDRYGIPKDRSRIIAHHEVPGSDHVDPGPLWDWTRYIRLVNLLSEPR
ncbi:MULTISPECIES: N-acetylmuramoyl-L-alanine amidase [unclassified Streptomyces]|uniref:N-acetylmuramoyl-L-alanine amidase n=1 Tax=unclassified Streptomyces TaxID=2593676 RepID=UPI001902F286|nr:N-acetylmuramoyl-L-alanine amidase [Streptomyces sp. HSG2]